MIYGSLKYDSLYLSVTVLAAAMGKKNKNKYFPENCYKFADIS